MTSTYFGNGKSESLKVSFPVISLEKTELTVIENEILLHHNDRNKKSSSF